MNELTFSGPIFDEERSELLLKLMYLMHNEAGWENPSIAASRFNGQGIWVGVMPKATERTKQAAKTLLAALKGVPLLDAAGSGGGDKIEDTNETAGQDLVVVTILANLH